LHALLQVYVRLNVPPSAEAASAAGNNQQPSALQLPSDALKVIAAAAKSRAGGSPGREATLFRQLLRDQLQAHLESVIKHAQFPTLLAMAVADADPSTGVPSASRQPSTLKRWVPIVSCCMCCTTMLIRVCVIAMSLL
jgi:hypothetical protein